MFTELHIIVNIQLTRSIVHPFMTVDASVF